MTSLLTLALYFVLSGYLLYKATSRSIWSVGYLQWERESLSEIPTIVGVMSWVRVAPAAFRNLAYKVFAMSG